MNQMKKQPLNPMEISFKKLYNKNPERSLNKPHQPNEVIDLLEKIALDTEEYGEGFEKKLFISQLAEDTFFEEGLDIAIYNHMKYLPPMYHKHNFFEVIYVKKGHGYHTISGKEHMLQKGDFCIVGPNTEHALSCFNDESDILNILIRSSTFEKTFAGMLQEKDLLTDFFFHTLSKVQSIPFILFETGTDNTLASLIENLAKELTSYRRYQKRMANAILNLLFIHVLREHDNRVIFPFQTNNRSDKELIYMLRYIQNNYRTVTLKQLADFFNFSERQVQRMIKTATGMNFRQTILKLKIEDACNLLTHGSFTIDEVSETLGYSDVSNFRHAFKRELGCPPSEYRDHHSID